MGGQHPDRYVMRLLNNILGGPAMTSRLNVAMREKAGLVYTVESLYSIYPDKGLWQVYFGCDPADVGRCRHIVEREIRHIIDVPLTPQQLHTAQKQFKGQIGISSSHAEQHAVAMGKAFALYGRVASLEQIFSCIDSITSADLQRVAAEWLEPANLSILIYK